MKSREQRIKRFVLAILTILAIIGASLILTDFIKQKEDILEKQHVSEVNEVTNEIVAPNFITKNINGSKFELYKNTDKPVVINFWATWCPICKEQLSHFEQLEDEYPNVEFLMIVDSSNNEDDINEVINFLYDNNLNFDNVLIDDNIEIAKKYAIPGYPTTIFIDEDKNIANSAVGAMDKEKIESFILNLDK